MTLQPSFPRAGARRGVRPGALLKRVAALWWHGVLTHVAEANGLPRPPPPMARWPFGHM
jgi:hypothetical protein